MLCLFPPDQTKGKKKIDLKVVVLLGHCIDFLEPPLIPSVEILM